MTWPGAVLLMSALAPVLAPALPVEARAPLGGRDAVPAMVRRVLPAVVSITTRQIETNQFNQAVPTRGLGSGFIVDRRGYILTNDHVVDGAEQIKVTLTDERSFRATLVGADRFTDLAVLKIDARDLPAVTSGTERRALNGVVEVVEDETHRWDSKTCGVVVMDECLER